LADLNRHHFEVQCRLEEPEADQRFTLPSWIPGSYLLREYARHVVSIRAESEGQAVAIEKVDKSTWRCSGSASELVVTAEVFALDLSVRGAYLDTRRGFFNGTCVFLSPQGREDEPVELTIGAPADPRCKTWKVVTAMPAEKLDERGFGLYRVENYDELIDHPVEISDFMAIDFRATGVPHHLILAGRWETDPERVATDLGQLCAAHIDFFGRPPPFESYWFLGLAVGEGYGGLEHRASCSLIFNRDDLPKAGATGVSRDYQRFLSLCSHEYFHAWNVKRIKPAAFVPYRLDRRNYTRLMWVFEGITSYYQDLLLLRSDLIGPKAYLERLGQSLSRVYRGPGRHRQSLAEASFDAWDKLYKPEVNSLNETVNYYSKGALVALALDLTIRRETHSRASLDHVMVALWQRFGREGNGLEENDFEALAEEVSGIELKSFFRSAVHGREDLPLSELLADFAVELRWRVTAGPEDLGGSSASLPEEPLLGLGVGYRPCDGGLELDKIIAGGPAERGGLIPGDVLIALAGLRVSDRNLKKRLARLESGESVSATVFRGDELLEFQIVLEEAPEDTCALALEDEPSSAALERRDLWLGTRSVPAMSQ